MTTHVNSQQGKQHRPQTTAALQSKSLATALAFCLIYRTCETGLASASVAYTYAKLQVPEVRVFFDARALSKDGRAGGYLRLQSVVNPVDLPTIWNSDGIRQTLAVLGDYRQAGVDGFRPDGVALGNVHIPPEFPGPAGYWNNGPFTALPDFGMGGAVNDANSSTFCGEVYELEPQGFYSGHPSIWTAAGAQRVTGLNETNGQCDNINEAGIYVGFADIPTGPNATRRTGFIGQDGTAQLISFPNINVIRANDINNSNRVIGHWSPDGVARRGFISTAFDDDFQDLGVLPGFAGSAPNAINDHGAIVGSVITNTNVRALIWQPGEVQPTDLNTLVNIPGETLVEAMDINNAGQILARGFNGYYIFTPIPEPATFASACMVLALMRRPRQLRR